jgi:hypothetical protein
MIPGLKYKLYVTRVRFICIYEIIVDCKILIQKSNEYILLYYLSSFLYNTDYDVCRNALSFHSMFLDFNLN